jgi:hypothetical protein
LGREGRKPRESGDTQQLQLSHWASRHCPKAGEFQPGKSGPELL